MSTHDAGDVTEEVIGALKQFFSAPMARALVLSTVRRARLDGGPLTAKVLPEVVAGLEQALPMYIADVSRRSECAARLKRLTPAPTAAASHAVSPAALTSTASTVIQIATAEDVANACDVGRDIARRIGFAPVVQTKIATAIAELARNIALYAISGAVRIVALHAPRAGIEVAANDTGPGISNLEEVMGGGYRSRTGMGMGLRGAKRLMDTFEIETSPNGTNILARKFLA